MPNGENYGKLFFVLIFALVLDALLLYAANSIVGMAWDINLIMGIIFYIVFLAVLSEIVYKLV